MTTVNESQHAGQPEAPRVNPHIAAEIDALMNEAQGDRASQAEAQAEYDHSPLGRWKAAITDIAPLAGMLHPDLAPTPEEVPVLADGLAPALAKHFPDMQGFTLPVELVAAYTVWIVFGPKVQKIRAARAAAAAPKEVTPDATPESA